MTEPWEPPEVIDPETKMITDRTWRVDKHIPLALILAIFVQTATIAWWAAGVSFRIEQLEKNGLSSASQGERLVKLETKFDALIDSVNEIRTLLRATRH